MILIADMTHYTSLLDPGAEVPKEARRLGEYLGRIVGAASLARIGAVVETDVRCRRRPGRRPCSGHVRLHVGPDGEITWECSVCLDTGLIQNWQGTLWDHSGRRRSTVH